ncbi:HAMP domain-containing protein [Paenibacillus sp. IHBB 3054]|uniref:HAMP domain-containing protein n=1 Tax=Paenibacillus sp. IHBB 3054 TaxID=3425689 RepID=UPI003F67BA80
MNIDRIRIWIKNQRIKKKIMLVYFPLVVIPIIALGFFSYIMNTDAIIRNTKKNVLDESRLIVMKIENVLSSSNASANILMQDLNKETKLKLIEPDESWQDELQTSDYDLLNRVEDRLDIAMLLFPEVDSAIFIDRSMHVYSTNPALTTGTREGLTSPMFRVIQQSNGKNIGFPMQRRSFWVMSRGDTVYTIGKKILDLETLETIGYLFVNINEKTFESVYRSVGSLQSSVYYVIDERGNIVSSSDKNRILTPAEQGTEVGGEVSAAGTVEKIGYSDGRKILYTSTGFEQQGWRLINETPLRELTRDSRQVSIVILVIGFICLLLAVFGAMILSKWIATPIMSLAQYMKRINEENIDKPLEVGRGDEVGILAAGLNKMMGRIQDLLNRVKNEQQKKREFELALILIEPIEMGMTESHWVELQINHPVIKAFNTIPWFDLTNGLSKDNPRRLATPIAGDDPVAKKVVCKLVDELGFDAVDAGGLDHSWRQQLGTSAFFAELDASDLRIALSEAIPERGYGIKAIHLSDNELKAEQEINSFYYKEIVRAVHILMEYNDLTEAEAMKSLCIHITTGNMLAHEILDCIFENKRLHKAQLSL